MKRNLKALGRLKQGQRNKLKSAVECEAMKPVAKYGNKKAVIDGIRFDSKREAARYQELKLLQRAGEIGELELQVKFELIPKNRLHRATTYTADFVYIKNGQKVVEDSKGYRTRDFIIRRKLMYHVHGIDVQEI